ncbi:hypothetical protein K435DRAFT_823362 [Dendrothele bispora CBS 962.96]|uniref:Uncharacterized protein n=1 Tax=Dendrothele bispora (strain CBS 962.96) TaxID=1314807 RepID=A0A4S8L0F8_DENBC|nr:hypothetical protein K435DRAFT_823362 [Dendrothele bispora CBS 962.96]
MAWFYNGHESKSLADLDNLVKDVIFSDDFQKEDLEGFSAKKVVKEMNEWIGPKSDLRVEDGWVEGSVEIPLPGEGVKKAEADAPKLKIDGIFYRKPLDVIQAVFQSERSQNFHYIPFKLFQRHESQPGNDSDDHVDIRLHHELYNSDAYIKEYEHIQIQQHERRLKDPKLAEEPEVENVPVGIMAWSDETHLTQFGDQSMWPIYIYFGNQSKYERAKPTSFAAHHLAYIPKLILDPEFMHAYEHGILVKCGDGIVRRLFPRFFTYSADYPEKVLLATIRSLGHCPCPHCLVEKHQIRQLGMRWDRSPRIDTEHRQNIIVNLRRWIFDYGYRIASQAIENTFSNCFYKFGTNFFLMFVPDVLHEIELGVWKAILTHLIRILFAYGNDTVQELDAR